MIPVIDFYEAQAIWVDSRRMRERRVVCGALKLMVVGFLPPPDLDARYRRISSAWNQLIVPSANSGRPQ